MARPIFLLKLAYTHPDPIVAENRAESHRHRGLQDNAQSKLRTASFVGAGVGALAGGLLPKKKKFSNALWGAIAGAGSTIFTGLPQKVDKHRALADSHQRIAGDRVAEYAKNQDALDSDALKKLAPGNYVSEGNQKFRKVAGITLDVSVGDDILMGKFKNSRKEVKEIGEDAHGMPTINGRVATTFRYSKEKTASKASDMLLVGGIGLASIVGTGLLTQKLTGSVGAKTRNQRIQKQFERPPKTPEDRQEDEARNSVYNDLAGAGLYEKVYSPAFAKAENAFTSVKSKEEADALQASGKYGKNEWDYAMTSVNNSPAVAKLRQKHGRNFNIVRTGSSENSWKLDLGSPMEAKR